MVVIDKVTHKIEVITVTRRLRKLIFLLGKSPHLVICLKGNLTESHQAEG